MYAGKDVTLFLFNFSYKNRQVQLIAECLKYCLSSEYSFKCAFSDFK